MKMMQNVSRLAVALLFAVTATGFGQINSYTGVTDGSWQTGSGWSLGVAPTNTQSAIFLTNATTKTITIDNTTPTGNLTISNLTLSAASGSINTLSVVGASSPFRILGVFTNVIRGVLVITNSTVQVENLGAARTNMLEGKITVLNDATFWITNSGAMTRIGGPGAGTLTIAGGNVTSAGTLNVGGDSLNSTGTLWILNGTLITTNIGTQIGGNPFVTANSNVGQVTMSNGVWRSGILRIGASAGGIGTLTINGGSLTNESDNIAIGNSGTGFMWVTGSGQVVITNAAKGNLTIANTSSGQMTLSNSATVLARAVQVANAGGNGTLTIAGGAMTVVSNVFLGNTVNTTGTVWLTGSGQLIVTNAALGASGGLIQIGNAGGGQMTLSNTASVLARTVVIANSANSGTLNIAGGTMQVFSNIAVGNIASGFSGTLRMTGGQLIATNDILLSTIPNLSVGYGATGQMIVTNATVSVGTILLGSAFLTTKGVGTLTIASGANVTLQSSLNTLGLIVGNGATSASGTGTLWLTGGLLRMANNRFSLGRGATGFAMISNGTLVANELFVGENSTGLGTLNMYGGSAFVTNATQTGALVIGSSGGGTLNFFGGTITTDRLLVTNGVNSRVNFNGGVLNTRTTLVNNAANFIVGNGTTAATLKLLGGGHVFANNLIITNAGQLQVQNSSATVNAPFLINRAGGTVSVQNASLTVNAVFTNAGTYTSLNSVSTFNRAVVNQGAWITDPTTNIFNANHTITASGYISAAAGDVFVFRSNLVNQSSQSMTWSTLNVSPGSNTVGQGTKFIFQGVGLTQTQQFQHTGLLLTGGFIGDPVPTSNGVQWANSPAGFVDNFAVGRLELTNTTLFLSQAFPSSTVTNALFVNDLFMFGAAHLIISNDMRLYFVNSNDWTMANVTLLGNAEIHQLVLVPEPSVLLLLLGGCVTLYFTRRRRK